MKPRFYFNLRHGMTVNAAVRVNGITIHQGSTTSQDGISGPVDHFLMPGENHLEVEVRGGDPSDGSAFFYAGILDAVSDAPLAQLDWPPDFPALPPPAPPYPTLQIRPFSIPDDHPKPLFFDAPVERVPFEGTPETWAPIRELHAAMERGDAAPIYGLFSTRAAEFYRFYGMAAATPAGARAAIDAMMVGPYDMLPLYRSDLAFKECGGGRAVQVLRLDGRPAIAGQCRANPKIRYMSNPVLVRHGGVYRIVA